VLANAKNDAVLMLRLPDHVKETLENYAEGKSGKSAWTQRETHLTRHNLPLGMEVIMPNAA
jgi:hypothetical protein